MTPLTWTCPFCGHPLPEEGEGLEALRLDPERAFCPRCGGEVLEEVQDDAWALRLHA